MKIMSILEKAGFSADSEENQTLISIGEAYSLWTSLVSRYDSLISTKTLLEFVKDDDLKMIIRKGIEVIESQKIELEKMTRKFSIPMPSRPPEDCTVPVDINTVTDQFIYREIYNGMSNEMFKHISNYQRAHGSYLREIFRKFLNEEMDLYDKFYEYGKLKTYLIETPSFRA